MELLLLVLIYNPLHRLRSWAASWTWIEREDYKASLSPHKCQHVCGIDVVGTWTDFSPPVQCQLASNIQGRQCVFFVIILKLRTALQRVDTSSEGYVMICMFWSWRMNIRCWIRCLANNSLPFNILGMPLFFLGPLGKCTAFVDYSWQIFHGFCSKSVALEGCCSSVSFWKGNYLKCKLMASSYF